MKGKLLIIYLYPKAVGLPTLFARGDLIQINAYVCPII
jgi:hypothetical protein